MLTSWNAQIVGRDNLLASNQKFFDSFKSLRIDVEKIALGQDTIMAEIRIVIDDNITAQVVDVFDFDQDNKIKAIRAYKR
jgi:steroid delta-isomerase